jgi:hypothetical protein
VSGVIIEEAAAKGRSQDERSLTHTVVLLAPDVLAPDMLRRDVP